MDSSELASRNIAEQEGISKLECEEWTDEKHGLFLKSMESTFVNQLYRSIEMFGLQSHKTTASRSKSFKQKQTSTRSSTAQFKVLRDGFWSKVEFQMDDQSGHDDGDDECKAPLSNPWIQRYRNSKIHSNKRSTKPTTNDTNIEVTDQNFNDIGAFEDNPH